MNQSFLNIINKYLTIFPNEKERQAQLKNFLETEQDVTTRKNFNGHITAGGLIYCKNTKEFLVLHHKSLNMFLFPGGHTENIDNTPLETAKREVREETGLENLSLLNICDDELIPIDIDTHTIKYNKKKKEPEHYHFDFRYLFILEDKPNIYIDKSESNAYEWVNISDLYNDKNYGKITSKLESILKEIKETN